MKRQFLLTGLTILFVVGIIDNARLSVNYKIIVHASNPVTEISREYLSKIFLKKIKKWENGSEVHPVDLISESPIRSRFSEEIHQRPTSKVKKYWQIQLFSGKEVPPPQFEFEKDVINYVNSDPASIGYLSAGTSIIRNQIKIISIKE
jgi:ABC-type phosphate transport system substrate-binding protein